MFLGTHLPCCPARPATLGATRRAQSPVTRSLWNLSLGLVGLLLTTAGVSAAVEESLPRFVGPPSREQPRLTNETGAPPVPYPAASEWLRQASLDPVPTLPSQLSVAANPTKPPTLLAQRDAAIPLEVIPHPRSGPNPSGLDHRRAQVPCFVAPPLSAITANIRALPAGELPADRARECATGYTLDPRLDFGWNHSDVHWSATCLCHKPLYFEEINAERYGYTVSRVLQPVISAGHFFFTIPALPYKMVVDRPCDCIYTLGHYRPGRLRPAALESPAAAGRGSDRGSRLHRRADLADSVTRPAKHLTTASAICVE